MMTRPKPIQPTMSRIRLSISTAPPFGVDRLGRQEQTERDETEVINEVRRIEHALVEVVEVVDDRQVLRQIVDRRSRKAAYPLDHPEHQTDPEGDITRHDILHL